MPRFTPYTTIGIRRLPCARCGKPAEHQWNICADKIGKRTQYRPLCIECDVGMNEIAMRYVWGNTREDDLAKYRAFMLGEESAIVHKVETKPNGDNTHGED